MVAPEAGVDGLDPEEVGVSFREAYAHLEFLEDVKQFYQIEGDDLLAAMLAMQIRTARLQRTQMEILREIRDQREPGSVGDFPYEMSHSVPADTQRSNPNTVEREPSEEVSTRIVAVSVGWQDGAENAVGVQLRTGSGLQLLPRNPEDDYIAFDNFSDTWGLDYPLDPGEKLIAQTINLDESNDHFVNIVPHIREATPRPGDEPADEEAEDEAAPDDGMLPFVGDGPVPGSAGPEDGGQTEG